MSCETMRVMERQRQIDKGKQKKKKPKKVTQADSKRIIKKQAEKFGWIVKDKSTNKIELTKPFTKDLIEVELMGETQIKFNVPGIISGANHANAEAFLRDVAVALNAKVISMVHNAKHAMAHAMGLHHHH